MILRQILAGGGLAGAGFGWVALIVSAAMITAVHVENRQQLITLHKMVEANQEALGTVEFALSQRLVDLAKERETVATLQAELGATREAYTRILKEYQTLKTP